MNIPRELIDLILTKIDLVDIISTQVRLQKSGANHFARCPFHQEKSASFSVSQPKQFYHCFGCGAHGNAIDFLMQHDRLSFPEAIETLARLAGVELPKTATPYKKDDSSLALYDLVNQVSIYYYEQMRKSSRAIDYLKKRGISGKLAQQFQIGFALPGWSHVLDLFGKSDSDKKKLIEAGLVIKKDEGGYYDRFRERIIFPIHDHRGRVIGFGGRVIDQGEPKYLNSPETPLFQKGHELYGLFQTLKANRKINRIIIVEGYMDVIALFQHGITYAVATLGTATTTHHIQRLLRYSSELIFCFDGDEAGNSAAWRALQILLPMLKDSLQICFLFLPDGEDPDTLIRKEGKLAFEKRITKALSLSAFFFQTLSRQSDLNTIEGRARFAASALNFIKQLPPGIFQGILLEELSKRARVDLQELKAQIKSPVDIKPSNLISFPQEQAKTKLSVSCRLALCLLIQQPSLAHLVQEPLPKSSTLGFTFLDQLIEIIKKNPNMTTGSLREYWRGQKEEPLVAKLATWDHMVPEAGFKSEFLGAIRQLTIQSLDEEINRLLSKAAQNELVEEEKIELSACIAKKKNLLATATQQ